MKTIWKFPLRVADRQVLKLPKGTKILSVANQYETLQLWGEVHLKDVDSIFETELRIFRVFGTGHQLPEVQLKFIGTVSMTPFVWHVYEEIV